MQSSSFSLRLHLQKKFDKLNVLSTSEWNNIMPISGEGAAAVALAEKQGLLTKYLWFKFLGRTNDRHE